MSVQDDLDPNSVGLEFIKEGADWRAIFNPKVPRQMDVKLLNKFVHERYALLHLICFHFVLTCHE